MTTCATKYDQYVTIEELIQATPVDRSGFIDRNDDDNWKGYEATYAACKSRGGREFWKVDQTSAEVSHAWRCPWSSRLAAAHPHMRLVHECRVHEILSVIDVDEAHHEVEIQTRRAV